MPQTTPSAPDARTVTEEIRRARAYLLRVAEPPAPALHAFVELVGPVEAAERIRRDDDVPTVIRSELVHRPPADEVDRDFRTADKYGARLVVPEDDEWPADQLACLEGRTWTAAPLALWVRGPALLDDALRRAVSVVGARSATAYGEHVATEFGYGLAEESVTVVSGAAYGIDGAAHRGALAAHGTTVAVLACGVDLSYPAAHTALLDQIAKEGAIVSEYAPGTLPAKHRFLVRNRLIAALASATVVVEAGTRSGSRNTATTAKRLGKPVGAVPGPVTSATSQGCHDLLRTKAAQLIETIDDVLALASLHTDTSRPG
ncbi:DNA processing protein [Actinokineospora iranica]|uniref:DNA processing protein n=1 Tax=Actinokineospora iranica TaxID=1271860 RepID=A0A1G6VRG3_9PSEU|nr:DNA-processing protein DprA [Actinokineospora iranica]SDD55577.1 DNA processing protein [Actinokineospora iranica]